MGGNFGTDGNYKWNFFDRLEEGQQTNNPSEGYREYKSKIEQLEAGNIHKKLFKACSNSAEILSKTEASLPVKKHFPQKIPAKPRCVKPQGKGC